MTKPQSIAGKYVHIHGPLRYFLELKPDKTLSYYMQEVGAPPPPDGFEYKPSTGTYLEEGATVKVHLEGGRLADIDGQMARDWQFRKEAGALVQQPEGTRFILETEKTKENDVTTAKLLPELPPDKAQRAIDEWVLPQLDSFTEMILHRPLKANEKTKDGVNTIVLVAAGNPIEVDGWRHIAMVRVFFNRIPVEHTPQPEPATLSAEQLMQYESRRNEIPKTLTLYSGPGAATFWHDTDGKWILISLVKIDPNRPLFQQGVTWQLDHGIEVKL